MAAVLRHGGHRRSRSHRVTAFACLGVTALAWAATTDPREEAMRRDHAVPCTPQASRTGREDTVRLPASLGAWSRSGELQTIGPAGIFEYMDGAGELYLAYRFERLEVAQYASREDGEILVELYWMGGSDDAYGLLSQDWSGEPVSLKNPPSASAQRALYGAGLLRIWSDDLYARVMATREGETSKTAVLAIGRAIAAGRTDPAPPRLVAAMPANPVPGYLLRPETVCFLRSHLVLNSAYFISQRDILDLGPDTEAVLASYRRSDGAKGGPKPRLLMVRYRDRGAARRALARFCAAYLPELPAKPGEDGIDVARVEDGWVGFCTSGRGLTLVFEAPEREVARSFMADAKRALGTLEASNG